MHRGSGGHVRARPLVVHYDRTRTCIPGVSSGARWTLEISGGGTAASHRTSCGNGAPSLAIRCAVHTPDHRGGEYEGREADLPAQRVLYVSYRSRTPCAPSGRTRIAVARRRALCPLRPSYYVSICGDGRYRSELRSGDGRATAACLEPSATRHQSHRSLGSSKETSRYGTQGGRVPSTMGGSELLSRPPPPLLIYHRQPATSVRAFIVPSPFCDAALPNGASLRASLSLFRGLARAETPSDAIRRAISMACAPALLRRNSLHIKRPILRANEGGGGTPLGCSEAGFTR